MSTDYTWSQLLPLESAVTLLDGLSFPNRGRVIGEGEIRPNLTQTKLATRLADKPDNINALLNGVPIATQATAWSAFALNHKLATIDGSLAITVGVNYLALLPVFIAGSAAQIRLVCERVHAGAYGSLCLTELEHGSNLLANETVAELSTGGGHYNISGEKQLINGGGQHELLMVLARSGKQGAAAFSLFLAERDASVSSPHRWHTLPMPRADISSVRFDKTRGELIGRKGRGFLTVQKTFALTRGGISTWAAGCANRATELAMTYAQQRRVRDVQILYLDPIADHLLHMRALDLLISSLSVKTCALLNRFGPAAVMHASAAKVVCCTLAEELVTEGRRLHSARALLTDYPYHKLVRDVILYAAFDGTTHVVLDQLQARLKQLVAQCDASTSPLALVQDAYRTAPRSLLQVSRQSARPLLLDPRLQLQALAKMATYANTDCLLSLANSLFATVAQQRLDGRWDTDQSLRLDCARCYGDLEALIALVELTDAGCRKQLGMVKASVSQPIAAFALYWYAARLAFQLSQYDETLIAVALECRRRAATARRVLLENRDQLTKWN